MSAIPVLAKENGDDMATPLPNRRANSKNHIPASVGRSFGTPLSNVATTITTATTSKKSQLLQQQQQQQQQSSIKKMVRARKLVQQHKAMTPSAPSTTTTPNPTATTTPTPNSITTATMATPNPTPNPTTSYFTYTLTFLPGSIGLQLEPAQNDSNVGCKVTCFVDGGIDRPGQARSSNQIQIGDEIIEINDDIVSYMEYNTIIDRLKYLTHMPRKILFRRIVGNDNSNNSYDEKGTTELQQQQQQPITPSTTTTPRFRLNSHGGLTPIVSPPKNHDNSERQQQNITATNNEGTPNNESHRTVLFMNPSGFVSPHHVDTPTTGNRKKPNITITSNTPIPLSSSNSFVPSSPAYNNMTPTTPSLMSSSLIPTPATTTNSSNNIVLDVRDQQQQNMSTESIDSSSTISPSKIKNLSQEDLELGLSRRDIFRRHNSNNNDDDDNNNSVEIIGKQQKQQKPLANVLRTVYNSVSVVGKVGSFDFGSKLGAAISSASSSGVDSNNDNNNNNESDLFLKKSQVLQNLNQAAVVVSEQRYHHQNHDNIYSSTNGNRPLESEEKKDETSSSTWKSSMATRSTPVSRVDQLEQWLQQANDRVTELTTHLATKQAEMDRRMRDTQEEANARVHEITQMQLATQTDLEHKLLKANTKLEELSRQQQLEQNHSSDAIALEQKLKEAQNNVIEITNARDEALASLETVTKELKGMGDKTESEKACQFEAQLHVAKLQRELRDAKKEIDTLHEDVNSGKSDMEDVQGRLSAAEEALQEKQKELEGTKCMMETYEEKFVERENEMDKLQEEIEFASRELSFARTEILKLETKVQNKEQEMVDKIATAEEEKQSLEENLQMTQKELDDHKQSSYDRERYLQMQLSARNSELEESNEAIKQLKEEAQTAAEKERCLDAALKKRDADLLTLNNDIDTNVASLKDQLERKERTLADTLAVLTRVETEKEHLQQELERQLESAKKDKEKQSELQANVAQRDEALITKEEELKSLRESFNSLQGTNIKLEKDLSDVKDTANGIYEEKSRINKQLQTTKVELNDAKVQASKIQDSLLQRAKELDNKAKEAQNELKKKESELTLTTGKLDRATTKIETLTADLKNKESSLQDAFSSIKSLEEERDQISRRENQLKTDMGEREREMQAMQEASRETKSQLFAATSRVSFLERQISASEASRSMAEKEMSALKDEVQSLTDRIEAQRETLDNTTEELSSKSLELMSLGTTVDKLREELQKRAEEVETAEQTLETSKAQYAQLHKSFAQAAAESSNKIQTITDELIKSQDEVAEKLSEQTKLERHIVELKQQLQNNEEQLSDLRSKFDSEKERAMALESTKESLKKESEMKLSELAEEASKHEALSRQLEEECERRTKDNATLKEELAGLDKKLASTRSLFGVEQNRYKKDRSDFETLIARQKQEFMTLSELLRSTQTEMEQQARENKSCRADLEDQLALLQRNISAKEARITELLADKEQNASTIANLKEDLSMANLEIQRLEESRTRSREELSHLNNLMDSQRTDHLAQIDAMVHRHNDETTKFMKEKEDLDATIRKGEQTREKMQRRMTELEEMLEGEREKIECLTVEQDALTTNLHRAEDLVAELNCEIKILKEEQSNDSVDSIGSDTLALSKSELRLKCKYLSEEIQEAEIRAAAGSSTSSQKQQHIRRLEEDMTEMSAELGRMIETSEHLESALLKARMDKANSDADAEALRTSIDVHQAKTKALKEELDQQYSENSELMDRIQELQQEQKESSERAEVLQKDLEESRQALQLSDSESTEAKKQVAELSEELTQVQERRDAAEARLSDLEFQVSKLEDDLSAAEKEKQALHSEAQNISEHYEEQLRELRSESAGLQSTISDLESEIETQKGTIRVMEENEVTLQDKLEKERKFGVKMESQREEAVSKLAEASRVLAAQKGIIRVQEARTAEAEDNTRKLFDENEALQETIKKLESATEENGMIRSAQLEDMEKKRALLEKARLNAKAEADGLRDEVRLANRRASELDRINKSLQSRIEELKHTAETTKAQLREARSAWTESDNLSRSLENDLHSSRNEIDHLRAKLQLCGATIARLKSDRVLDREAAMQAEISSSNSGDQNAVAMSQVKAELHTKNSQLSSASASIRSYKKMCQDMKTTEQQLVIFIEDIIVRADSTFHDLSKVAAELKALSEHSNAALLQEDLKSLDLATPGTPQKVIDDANCCLHKFVSLIQQASVDLEGKRRKLDTWKAQNTHHTSTPQNKSGASGALLTPNAHSLQRTFRKMKEVIDTQCTAEIDCPQSQVQAVILSLEGQIDALCSELKFANTALRSKEQQFVEMQQAHLSLQKKHEQQQQSDCTAKSTVRKQLSAIQEVSDDEKEKLQMAAGRMMCKVFENRDKAEVASALRKWSNSTAAMHAAGQQKDAAAALSKQLEMTRGKLVQLKAQFKRGKATSTSSSSLSMTETPSRG